MDLPNTSRSSRSSVGMQQRTQSVQNGMPTRSMGTIVFSGAPARDGFSEHLSFLTRQRGNAVHDALRRKRTQSVQNGMSTRGMGTTVFSSTPAGTVFLQPNTSFSRSCMDLNARLDTLGSYIIIPGTLACGSVKEWNAPP
ncbi:DUF1534 domain-containing protein [Pseudomonas syringae UB303]|uniref:DUF1534 domain-containing protein n=1 Tax=Pseudomonas syringae UB303 TaxID=1357287 RepID=A0AAJ4AXP6_PSESX|nr:DUF1534 domain-containing protein [Pseudomonas syringae UB303]